MLLLPFGAAPSSRGVGSLRSGVLSAATVRDNGCGVFVGEIAAALSILDTVCTAGQRRRI